MATLINENFRGLSSTKNGNSVVASSTISSDTDDPILVHSTEWSVSPDGFSLKVDTASSAIAAWTLSSRANTFISGYFMLAQPLSNNSFLVQVRNGTDAAIAAQLGFTALNEIRIRNVSTAVGSLLPVNLGQSYRFEWSMTTAGTTQTLRLWTGSTLHSRSTLDASAVSTGTYSSATASKIQIGSILATVGGFTCYADQFRADDTTMPVPTLIDTTDRNFFWRRATLL
jgi:hypothetical protein